LKITHVWADINIAAMALFLEIARMIGRMLIMFWGFSIEKGKLLKAYMSNMSLRG
jgi:hypothetical protein